MFLDGRCGCGYFLGWLRGYREFLMAVWIVGRGDGDTVR